MGSAVDRYPPSRHKRMKEDPDSYVDFQREIVADALKNRGVCPSCDTEGCHMMCSKCRTVVYCSKRCQVTDWPSHKIICRHVKHVVQVISSMKQSTRRDFLAVNCSFALCAFLRMEGIDADFTQFCETHDKGETDYRIFNGVVAGGHLYNLDISFFNTMRPPGRNIEPLPPSKELKKRPHVYWAVNAMKSINFGPPWGGLDFDEYEVKIIRRFECSIYMEQHYVDCDDREAIIKLYGRKKIETASKEKLEVFRKRLDDLIARNPSETARREELHKNMRTRFAKLIVEVESLTGWTRFFKPPELSDEKDSDTTNEVLDMVTEVLTQN